MTTSSDLKRDWEYHAWVRQNWPKPPRQPDMIGMLREWQLDELEASLPTSHWPPSHSRRFSLATGPQPPLCVDQDAKVWAVCDHGRRADGESCKRCPELIEVEGHGRGTPGCYLHALGLVNIVETGNAWRKPR